MNPAEINTLPHDDPRRIQAWQEATADHRAATYQAALAKALAAAEAALEPGKSMTAGKRDKAATAARAATTAALYRLAEHDGLRNPIHDDPTWAPDTKTEQPREDIAGLAAWLEEQTWSQFAQSLAAQYRATKRLSPKQVEAAKSMKAKSDAKAAEKADTPTEDTGIDLTTIPSGTYAVPAGDTRLKVRIRHATEPGKWNGWTFVDDGAEYGQRKNYGRQAPGGTYQGQITDQLRAILANPAEAAAAYGRLTGHCAMCGRKLEDEASVAAGIGPICAGKFA